MIIDKMILHIFDSITDIPVISDVEFKSEIGDINNYIVLHLQKSFNDNDGNFGTFIEQSELKKMIESYKEEKIDFVELSKFISQKVFQANENSDEKKSMDVLVCEARIEEVSYICGLIFYSKLAYTHKVSKELEKVKNEVMVHHAILPATNQKVDEYFFVGIQKENIKFKEKNIYLDGKDVCMLSEIVLQCTKNFSVKQTIKLMNNITKKVAEKHEEDSVKMVSRLKSYIADNVDVTDKLDPIDIGNEVFLDKEELRCEFINETQKIDMKSIEKIDRKYLLRTVKKQKIQTDTGIEISFPVDYYQNSNMIEFINNDDGTISIELKNIGKIINK